MTFTSLETEVLRVTLTLALHVKLCTGWKRRESAGRPGTALARALARRGATSRPAHRR